MNAVQLGPFAWSAEGLAVVGGILVVYVAGAWLGQRVDRRFGGWALAAVAAALFGARAAYVLQNFTQYSAEPLGALAVWDGGLAWPWGALAAAVPTALILRRPSLIGLGAGVIAVSAMIAAGLAQLGGQVSPKRLPAMTLQTLDSGPLQIDKSDGRPTVVNLWATWCPPCRRELPMLADEARAHPEVRFVFADQGEPAAVVRQRLASQGLSPPLVALDPDQALARYYAVAGLPTTLFILPDGRLAAAHLGQIPRPLLERNLTRLKP